MNIGWDRCVVYDIALVKWCYNSWSFNHVAKECKNKFVCVKCSGDHDARDCNNPVLMCNNCLVAKTRLGLNLNVSHNCRSELCEVYVKKKEIQKIKIAY